MSTLEQTIGNTPLVKLQRMGPNNGSEVWLKLEGNNPAGSVKDRAALSMIVEAEKRGEIKPGDVLIEATSGNTGIALAMIAALKGYRMKLLMPDNMSQERRAAMRAYGAELILVTKEQGMEGARDLALEMANRGEGKLLDQFNNPDNPYAHYTTTGPEIWQQTGGRITHFVSSMGTTGTITGVSRFMREQSKPVTIVGLQPEEGSSIPGIRRWPTEYLPGILGQPSEEYFNILIAHDPDYFPKYADWGADLVLSGHVHGGMVRVPFWGKGVVSPNVRLFPKYDGGEFTIGKSRMLLSRGLGMHTIPIRLFNPGEILEVELMPDEGK